MLHEGDGARLAEELRGLAAELEALLERLAAPDVWRGADAERLRDEWRIRVSLEWRRAAEALETIRIRPGPMLAGAWHA